MRATSCGPPATASTRGPGGYYTNFLFVPAYRDGAAPYGTFPAPELLTTAGWQLTGQYGVDVGAAIPTTNEAGQTLTRPSSSARRSSTPPATRPTAPTAIPAAKRFNGQRLRVCNTAWSRNDTSGNAGHDGRPVRHDRRLERRRLDHRRRQLASVVSYGYGSLKNVLFGPHLEVEAQRLYNDAKAAAAG